MKLSPDSVLIILFWRNTYLPVPVPVPISSYYNTYVHYVVKSILSVLACNRRLKCSNFISDGMVKKGCKWVGSILISFGYAYNSGRLYACEFKFFWFYFNRLFNINSDVTRIENYRGDTRGATSLICIDFPEEFFNRQRAQNVSK